MNALDRLLGPRRFSVAPRSIPPSELGPALGPIPGLELGTRPPFLRTYAHPPITVIGLTSDASGTDLVGSGAAGAMVTPHVDPTGGVYQTPATAGVGRVPSVLSFFQRRPSAVPTLLRRILPQQPATQAPAIPAGDVQSQTAPVEPATAPVAVTFDGQPATRDASGVVHVAASAAAPAFTYTPGEHLLPAAGDSPDSNPAYAGILESLVPGAGVIGEVQQVGSVLTGLFTSGSRISPVQQAQNRALLAAYESSPEYAAVEAEIASPAYDAQVQAALANTGREN